MRNSFKFNNWFGKPVIRQSHILESNSFNTNDNQKQFDDMKRFAIILANVTDRFNVGPEQALTVISDNIGWLYSQNLPRSVILHKF